MGFYDGKRLSACVLTSFDLISSLVLQCRDVSKNNCKKTKTNLPEFFVNQFHHVAKEERLFQRRVICPPHKFVLFVASILWVVGEDAVCDTDALVVAEDFVLPKVTSPGGSSTSSRDGSPNRDVSPLTRNLNPPIVLKRGTKGFGFGFRSVRVYIGETNVYMLQHIVTVSGLSFVHIGHVLVELFDVLSLLWSHSVSRRC